MKSNVSLTVVRRLPRYYRYLNDLLKNGVKKVSSKGLSEQMGITASQIRQDFNCFGGFGQQGYGYNVEILQQKIGEILCLNQKKTAVLIGAGNLGHALANHSEFQSIFKIIGIFDSRDKTIGEVIRGVSVTHIDDIDDFVKNNKIDIAIIAVAKNTAECIVRRLVELGIKGFWNFTNIDMEIPDVIVENVHLSDSLMTLSYCLENNEQGEK